MMSQLHLIKAEIVPRPFRRWMASRHFYDVNHASHSLLTEMFGQEVAPKPFRILWRGRSHPSQLLGYGQFEAASLRRHAAAYADPDMAAALPKDSIASRTCANTEPDANGMCTTTYFIGIRKLPRKPRGRLSILTG